MVSTGLGFAKEPYLQPLQALADFFGKQVRPVNATSLRSRFYSNDILEFAGAASSHKRVTALLSDGPGPENLAQFSYIVYQTQYQPALCHCSLKKGEKWIKEFCGCKAKQYPFSKLYTAPRNRAGRHIRCYVGC